MRKLLLSLIFTLFGVTVATAAMSAAAQAELYLGVRPAADLTPDESRGTFLGSWDRVLIDDQGQVQTLSDLTAAHGSLLAATQIAEANTGALLSQAQFDDAGGLFQVTVDPMVAANGLFLHTDFADVVRAGIGTDAFMALTPADDLLVVVPYGESEDDQSDLEPRVLDLAMRVSAGLPNGLDAQVIRFRQGAYSLVGPFPTPTAEEILMSLGPDPENTLVITLKDGDVVIRMRDDLAPNHVARIKELARDGFYDGLVFHRVIEGFMAQTGDPTGTGTSGSGQNLNAEFTDAPFLRGTVGMARAASPNSADSQFFIMFAEGRFLDGNYTVIGQVESGMEFVDQIKRGEPPVDPDKMISVKVQADI